MNARLCECYLIFFLFMCNDFKFAASDFKFAASVRSYLSLYYTLEIFSMFCVSSCSSQCVTQ